MDNSTTKDFPELLVELTRGSIVESVHLGSIAVADTAGRLLAWAGNPRQVVYLRSSAKPFQALPLVETGAAEAFGLEDGEIAIACASHTGTDAHIEAVRRLQMKAGVREEALLCGVHPPADRPTWRELIRRGEEPTVLRHNCSGKHSGMLAAARHLQALGVDSKAREYIDPAHPLQRRILEGFAAMCGLSPDDVVVGTDGCSAPNFAVPLASAATAAARLMDPGKESEVRASACKRIVRAMTANPEFIRGAGGFDTEIMRAGGGLLVSKAGAEGCQLIGLAAGAAAGLDSAVGIALKIQDGDGADRAADLVAMEVLEQLGVRFPATTPALDRFRPRALTNWRGLEVGRIRPAFTLRRA